jgi:ATP-dependent RNA helicase DDX27
LREAPDIIVATPGARVVTLFASADALLGLGRLIDHLRNTQGFDLDALEVLVMDEADRLLELGFEDEIAELLRMLPRQRQTLLLSATMTESVERLTKLSLHQPVRINVDPLLGVAATLTQEFVRVRDAQRRQRTAILLALCTRSITSHCIIFCARKVEAHRLKIVFGLCGLRAAELHGDMKQRDRLEVRTVCRRHCRRSLC